MVIFDADIISMFTKAGVIDVLIKTLSKFRLCITPRIKDEISMPLHFGYSYPQIIFDKVELIFPAILGEPFERADNKVEWIEKFAFQKMRVSFSQ
jgi:hypothetical protein